MEKHIDPVCGMEVDEQNAVGKSEFEGRPFYLCSLECQKEFDANPQRFSTDSESQE